MGCRTRANLYYGREVEGSVVRKTEEMPAAPERMRPVHRRQISASAQRRLRKQKVKLVLAGLAAAAVIIALCCIMLTYLDLNGTLSDEIYSLENQIEDMTIRNDARDYEIHNSVDLNEVIRVATEELGMVRSSQAQVVTYRVKNAEYVQQLAAVPVN